MNSVALPASVTTTALETEADLIRRAARGDEESFGELYRRHGQMAWRVAQATAVDRDGGVAAVAEGFGRTLRGLRRHGDPDGDNFRPLLLAAVYRSAIDRIHAQGVSIPTPVAVPAAQGEGSESKAADAALVEAAFRSLPERWRAAVWLSEVESMEAERIAPILGVSIPVATQLARRGRQGLLGRFAQAHRPEPEHLGSALRLLADSVPANLADATASRWKALVADPTARFAPITGWLGDRAVRPLWASVGGLIGLGIIGLGLVGESGAIKTGPVATGAVPAGVTAPGLRAPGSLGTYGTVTPGGGLNSFNLGSGAGSGGGAGTDNGSVTTFGNTPGSQSYGGDTGTPNQPPSGGTSTPQNPPPGTGTPQQVSQVLPLAPVLSITQSNGTTSVNLLPTSDTTTSTCSGGTGVTVQGQTPSGGCVSQATAPTVQSPLSPSSSSLTSPVSTVTDTATSTTLPQL